MPRLADAEADMRKRRIGRHPFEELAQLFERIGLQQLQARVHSAISEGAP